MIGEVTVVPMTAAHVDALMAYEHEMFGPEAWSPAAYRAEIADTGSRVYVALEASDTRTTDAPTDADATAGPRLLGWGGLLVAADTAEITTIGIVPPAQRQGLGRRLLDELTRLAAARGARELFLEVRVDNTAARAMYDAAGFAVVGRRRGYYDRGRVDAVVMRRDIGNDSGPGEVGEQ